MLLLAALSAGTMMAQDLSGTWQGTLTTPDKKELRIVTKLSKDGAGYKAAFYSIDQTPQPIAASVTVTQTTVTLVACCRSQKLRRKARYRWSESHRHVDAKWRVRSI